MDYLIGKEVSTGGETYYKFIGSYVKDGNTVAMLLTSENKIMHTPPNYIISVR